MRKAYSTPSLALTASVVRDTLLGPNPSSTEIPMVTHRVFAGSLGFYL